MARHVMHAHLQGDTFLARGGMRSVEFKVGVGDMGQTGALRGWPGQRAGPGA